MTDQNIRALERQAHTDPHAKGRLLMQRFRVSPLMGMAAESRMSLLAYCGDEVASLMVSKPDWCYRCEGPCFYTVGETQTGAMRCPECLDFTAWLNGLNRWPPCVLTRAAIAAAGVAERAWIKWHMEDAHGWYMDSTGKAIAAAKRWVDDPTEANREACGAATDLNSEAPGMAACEAIRSGVDASTLCDMEIQTADTLSPKGAVRAAICAALREWAL